MVFAFVAPALSSSASTVASTSVLVGNQRQRTKCHRQGHPSFSLSTSSFTPYQSHLRVPLIRYAPPEREYVTVQQPFCKASVGGENDPSKNNAIKRELSLEVKELRSVLKKCSLYLVGPMGSGKSAIGKYLARELGFHFLDTDDLIENLMQKKVSEIFAESGEAEFREIEAKVLEQTSSFIGCCVATGGGIVLRKDNWGSLQTGIVIYLKTSIEILYHRLSQNDNDPIAHRPLLSGAQDPDELRDRIERLLNERDHLYRQADIVINVSNEKSGVDDVAKETIRVLTNFIKANPPKLSKLYPESDQLKK